MSFVNGKLNATNEQELADFNTHLESRAYLNGYLPSKEDYYVYKCFTAAPSKKYTHVSRWYTHIASYTEQEASNWTKYGSAANATSSAAPSAPAAATEKKEEAKPKADEDFDLFGEESDDEEKKRITEERLKAYNEKKSKKPGPIAKSNVIFDVKPWDDTVDVDAIEKAVRGITMEGLVWGASKILPVAYGVKKLQIMCVIEDEKVSTDVLEEEITGFEDLVQSIDVVAFNKV